MACELPVVATAAGDAPERLSGVPGCHVVVDRKVEPLAEALLSALAHGRSPQARIEVAELSLPRIAERVLEVYRSVCSDQPA
jgi:glycosyltransferase involved in cell wall biosynthesis